MTKVVATYLTQEIVEDEGEHRTVQTFQKVLVNSVGMVLEIPVSAHSLRYPGKRGRSEAKKLAVEERGQYSGGSLDDCREGKPIHHNCSSPKKDPVFVLFLVTTGFLSLILTGFISAS
ncbi:hypothetical protein R3P38DRAFT_2784449 [Favolaschia claudopus]|uniref:Uncharacterized protein n=1 Tax=Favolaschia claudopus TaxID=2862362 RepID=A0AAW0AWC4_9AGAR